MCWKNSRLIWPSGLLRKTNPKKILGFVIIRNYAVRLGCVQYRYWAHNATGMPAGQRGILWDLEGCWDANGMGGWWMFRWVSVYVVPGSTVGQEQLYDRTLPRRNSTLSLHLTQSSYASYLRYPGYQSLISRIPGISQLIMHIRSACTVLKVYHTQCQTVGTGTGNGKRRLFRKTLLILQSVTNLCQNRSSIFPPHMSWQKSSTTYYCDTDSSTYRYMHRAYIQYHRYLSSPQRHLKFSRGAGQATSVSLWLASPCCLWDTMYDGHNDNDDSYRYSIRHYWTDVPPGEVCFGHHRGVDSSPGHNNLISGAWNLERIPGIAIYN